MIVRRLLVPIALVLILVSCGDNPDGPGNNMTITVTTPPQAGAEADSSFTISWDVLNLAAGATVTLAYDIDVNPSSRVLIENGLDPTSDYEWDCKFVPEGTYYIYAMVTTGTSSASDYSDGTVTLTHPWASPMITVTKPPAGGAEADSMYTIEWETQYFDKATVNLYYETDTVAVDTVLIAKSLEDTGTHDWDCRQIGIGQYYIFAKATEAGGHDSRTATAVISSGLGGASRDDSMAVDHSAGPVVINHGGSLPQITILTPPLAGDKADSTFLIRWTALAIGDVEIDLYYDTDTMPGTGLVQIAAGLPDSMTYVWDCSAVPEGEYYIYGEVKDVDGRLLNSFRASGTDYSDGTVRIDHSSGYGFVLLTPPAGGVTADSTYKLMWNTDVPETESIDLFYSADTSGSELFTLAEGVATTEDYIWDLLTVPEGDWWVFGTIEMTVDTLYDWSPGALTVEHLGYSMEVTAPPDTGATADSTYTIEWIASGPTGATVDLFYDKDKDPSSMTEITLGLDNTGSYEWDTFPISEGEYYIYAVILGGTDGSGNILSVTRAGAADYSDSTLVIEHPGGYELEVTQPPLEGADADTSYTIEWTSTAPPTMLLDVYYSADTVGSELFIAGHDLPNTGEWVWDCSAAPEGDWYIYAAFITDENYDWSAGQLSIAHQDWTMEVLTPPAGGASADSSYTIEWTAEGSAGAVVDLFYDKDTEPSSMTEIEPGLPNTGTYEWNTLQVGEGEYYVYALIHPPGEDPFLCRGPSASDYSDGTITITHTEFYVLVTAPPAWGATADSTYRIEWAASAPAGSDIDLYYDTDTVPGSGLVEIVTDLDWDDYEYTWVCDPVPEGEYYVYALLDDGSSTTSDYSDSTVVIEHDPLFLYITTPGPAGDTADDVYDIWWYSQGPEDRVIDLYYDTDQDPSSGLVSIIEDLPSPVYSNMYRWSCETVPEGVYYIFGVLWDSVSGGDSLSHYSVGELTIEHP